MGFYGGGQGDKLFAEFQAKMLLYGKQPDYDPAEERMRWFLTVLIVWTVLIAIVAGGVQWLIDDVTAAVTVAAVTLLAVAIRFWARRAVATLDPEPEDVGQT